MIFCKITTVRIKINAIFEEISLKCHAYLQNTFSVMMQITHSITNTFIILLAAQQIYSNTINTFSAVEIVNKKFNKFYHNYIYNLKL